MMEPNPMSPELIDALNIDDFARKKDYGRERGLNPSPTEAQTRTVDKLAQKINTKTSSKAKKEDEEEALVFDLKSKPRVILFEAAVLKRSTTAIVQHHTKRHGYLFNDILLITSSTTSTSMVNFSSEKINIHQIFYLDQISIRDLKNLDEAEDPAAFEIMASDRNYIYVAESEQDKRIWIEELTEAMFCIYSTMPNKNLGWFHEVIRGTFHSAAYYGDLELVRKHISRAKGKSLDVNDESGMNPLHWAALNGHQETVALLIESGAEVDALNSGLNTPLLIASAFGHRDVIFCLLDHSSDVYIRNLKDYDCLLMLLLFGAYGSNAEEIISAFKVRGIDINKQDITGVTPLHECSSRNLPISIQALVDAGADINMKHGRNGLTPLQLACSSAQPDAETIRSLLDKGALPNWKDINKQTAFDMICKAKQKSVVSVKNADTTSPSGLKKTIDSAADFIQLCLPALMELVRKGARFTPEAMELFRPSFREMIQSGRDIWKQTQEPENFHEYVGWRGEAAFQAKNWMSDSASQCCTLCLDKFTYSNRRHHCRTCGTLCCDPCSTKRLRLKASSPSLNTPPSSGSKSSSSNKGDNGADRICDSCFNKYVFESAQWHIAVARARKEQLKLEQRLMEQANSKAGASGGAAGSVFGLTSAGGNKSPTTGSNSGKYDGVMADTARALEERGQKIQEVAEKSEQMREAASEFRQMTRQLLKQQQQHTLYSQPKR